MHANGDVHACPLTWSHLHTCACGQLQTRMARARKGERAAPSVLARAAAFARRTDRGRAAGQQRA
eukprot:355487-Chlamydomonas_euryale.AAC.7